MLRLIETFSGIGSQVQALKNSNIDYSVEAIVEWEIGAMYAYDIIHNGPQDLTPYRHHTKLSLISELQQYNLSGDGKEPLSERALNSMSVIQMKSILCAIERNNNLVDITTVKARDLPEADILTYSFPCQDLSVSGHWHKNTGGIDRDANNRSTLLWQIERILKEFVEEDKGLPKFLLMENVSNILSEKHIGNFNEWQEFLRSLGYVNQIYTLNARDFGVPQSRIRTYLVSVLVSTKEEENLVNDFFIVNNLESFQLDSIKSKKISEYLRLDYSVEKYLNEAIDSTPALTPSRVKIYENNVILASDNKAYDNLYARTITTKQDRHPNSGIIEYNELVLTEINTKYRNLTPRECFLLMGFKESQFDLLIEHNIKVNDSKYILPTSKLIRLAGNSIVVDVLESIFKQINEIDSILESEKAKVNCNSSKVL